MFQVLHRFARAAALAGLLLLPVLGGCASTKIDPLTEQDRAALRQADSDAAALFARGETLRADGKWSDARKAFTVVHEDFPASPLAGEAQFQAAECAYGDGRYYAAGQLFKTYIEDRPLSPHVNLVEKRMYDIGEYLIEDGKRGLWGMGIFETSGDGIALLRNLSSLLPTGTYADDALMRVGRWYAAERDYTGAELTLDELLKNYSDSEWRLEARLLLAWTFRRDNRGPEYDAERLRRSRAHFLAYVTEASVTPDRALEHAADITAATAEVTAIEGDLARKALARATLYERMEKPDAAVFVLEQAAREWGRTEPGRECVERAASLRASLGRPVAPPPAPAPAPPVEGTM
jgi:outer membrane protein assembly factor BamD (BamD/ComL family)